MGRRVTRFFFFCRIPAGQECKLSCLAEVGVRQFAKFSFGHVDDGTRCDDYDENSGLCINGKCQVRLYTGCVMKGSIAMRIKPFIIVFFLVTALLRVMHCNFEGSVSVPKCQMSSAGSRAPFSFPGHQPEHSLLMAPEHKFGHRARARALI